MNDNFHAVIFILKPCENCYGGKLCDRCKSTGYINTPMYNQFIFTENELNAYVKNKIEKWKNPYGIAEAENDDDENYSL